MSRRKERDACARCGAASDAPIHSGSHPTRCHAFEPRRAKPAGRLAKVVPIDPDRFPRLVARGELHVGDRVLQVGRVDECDELVFVGQQPVADLLGGPGDEPHDMARRDIVTEDGEVVPAFEFEWTVEQLMSQAGRHDGPGRPALSPEDHRCARESRALLEHIFRAALDGVIRKVTR
ncbi:hypothetical protein [Sorangium sp. So ce1000]|uniref:hypothetical protein n=1 Tax=Sorangium sp. So ce1000 TaxID=3133325 RepID=UPI003F623F69